MTSWFLGAGGPFWNVARSFFILTFLASLFSLQTSCSILETRPVQEMSDTAAALRAAREVQAEVVAAGLFRKANEHFFRARKEYKFKNFKEARVQAKKARKYAEEAEWEAIRKGATRSDISAPDPYADMPAPKPYEESQEFEPYDYPEPTGTPAFLYERNQQSAGGNQAPAPAPSP